MNVFVELFGELCVNPAITALRLRIGFENVVDDGAFTIAGVDDASFIDDQHHAMHVAYFLERVAGIRVGLRGGRKTEEQNEKGRG